MSRFLWDDEPDLPTAPTARFAGLPPCDDDDRRFLAQLADATVPDELEDQAKAWIADDKLYAEVAGSVREAVLKDLPSLRERLEQLAVSDPALELTETEGRKAVVFDARSRSLRTFFTGLGFDVGFALLALAGTLTGEEFLSTAGLATLGTLALKTVITSAAAYVARLRFTPTARTTLSVPGLLGDTTVRERVELRTVAVPVRKPSHRRPKGKKEGE